MKTALKYGIIAAAWILYFAIAQFGNSNNTNDTSSVQTGNIQIEQSIDKAQEEAIGYSFSC